MSGLRQLGVPPTVSSPRDGSRKPAIRCSRVDLPAPFGPSSPVTPGPMVIVMSLTATTLPYQRDTLRSSTVIIGSPPARRSLARLRQDAHWLASGKTLTPHPPSGT